MKLPLVVLIPFVAAALPALAVRRGRWTATAVALLAPLISLCLLLPLWQSVRAGFVPRWKLPWMPQLGLELDFRADGLAFFFAALVLGIGALVVLYSRYYLSERDDMGRFYAYLLLFMGAMTGMVLSGNLLQLAIFWELTTLTSFLLIGYWTGRADARDGARVSLIVTGLGGLALLGGVILIGRVVGSFDLDVVLASGDLLRAHPLYPVVLTLVLIGAFTKSAQVPFHFWLPAAMAAPTPVSAYLHSATMVKAGVFLLARLHPALAGSELWFNLVVPFGLLTLVVGAWGAIFQNDLKGLLAYSTVSHLGLITLLLGIGTPLAVTAAVFHVMNHAAFKAGLFMAAGIIDHETGSRDLRTLNGLWKYMPVTGALTIIATAAMAGVPLFNGFLSKEMFFTEALGLPDGAGALAWIVPAGALLFGVFSAAYSLRFVAEVFLFGDGTGMPKAPHEPPRTMRVPVEVLALLCVLIGFFPNTMVRPLLDVAAAATAGAQATIPAFHLAQWHGPGLPLFLSLLALAGGIALYLLLRDRLAARAELRPLVSAKDVFEWIMASAAAASRALTNLTHNGSLQRYTLLVLLSALVVGVSQAVSWNWSLGGDNSSLPADLPTATGAVVLMSCAIATAVLHRRRLLALIVTSGVGLMTSLAFVRFGAPDLALTQLLVEVVATMIMLLALFFLPQTDPGAGSRPRVVRDWLVAAAAGGGVAAIVLAVLTRPLDSISGYFVENTVSLGGGTNIVNVILVDFRGFDTMGEIAVIGTAALGVSLMLDGLRGERPGELPTLASDVRPLVLGFISRAILPFALLMSAYVFLRGHNLPGGGFIAGLFTAIGIALQYMSNGLTWTRERVRGRYRPWIGWGVLTAVASGVIGMLAGSYFLDLYFTHVHIPLIGDIELAMAAMFDLGVYITVVAAVLLILSGVGALGEDGEAGRARFAKEADPWKV